MTEEAIRAAFQRQARACDHLGSPFTARLCRLMAERLQAGSAVADTILQWQGDPSPGADSVPLRLAGCLHALVLEERDERLKAAYPPSHADDVVLWDAMSSALDTHEGFIIERLQSAPQTNEVRRSAALLPGFLSVAALFRKPLVLSEVGASAGLNLNWDRYVYRLGALSWGSPQSPVSIEPEWRGNPIPRTDLAIEGRAACDLNPIDAGDPAQRLRMLSYIWADQSDRLARTRAALDIAADDGQQVEKADAIEWLTQRLRQTHAGATHVIYNTIAWQYLPQARREEGEAIIASAGDRATAAAPLAWLQLEADGQPDGAAITLQIWPSGETQTIGRADFHGRWVDWRGWR